MQGASGQSVFTIQDAIAGLFENMADAIIMLMIIEAKTGVFISLIHHSKTFGVSSVLGDSIIIGTSNGIHCFARTS